MDGLIALALAKKGIKGVTKSIAEEYDPTKEYAEGALAIKDGKLQKYVGGEWVETVITDNIGGGDIQQSEEEYVGEVVGGTLAPIDATLSIAGAAADAKATGDAIAGLGSSKADELQDPNNADKVWTVGTDGGLIFTDKDSIIAGKYDPTKAYAVGDHTVNGGKLYVKTSGAEAAEEWTPAHWTEVTVGEEISQLSSSIASISPTLNKSADTTFTIAANETHIVTGTPTALNVTLAAPATDKDSMYGLMFKAGASFALTDTAPTGYSIVWTDEPTWTAETVYEIIYRYLHIDGIISAKWSEVERSA